MVDCVAFIFEMSNGVFLKDNYVTWKIVICNLTEHHLQYFIYKYLLFHCLVMFFLKRALHGSVKIVRIGAMCSLHVTLLP